MGDGLPLPIVASRLSVRGWPGRLVRPHLHRRLPTTSAGVEWLLAATFLGFRGLNVVQTSIAVVGALLMNRPHTLVDGLAVAVLAVESGWLAVRISRRGAYREDLLGWTDGVTGVVLLAATVLFTSPGDRFTSWADWGYPVTLSVAFGSGLVFRQWWKAAVPTAALITVYLLTTMPAPAHSTSAMTAVTNAVTYPVAAGLAWLVSAYLRRLGSDADRARAEAARLAATLERRRHQDLLHDHATVLDVLAREDPDHPVARLARAQAATSSARIRAFLRGQEPPPGTLAGELATLGLDYGDLPLTLNVALAAEPLPPEVVATLVSATRTLLDNVRWHARAEEVVVHAAASHGRWELTVTDDGIGFDPAAVAEGYGLSRQVRRAVAEIGGAVEVLASPGSGSTVRLHSGGG